MLLKSVFIANAIAGAVASPASLQKRQDVSSYIEAEKPCPVEQRQVFLSLETPRRILLVCDPDTETRQKQQLT